MGRKVCKNCNRKLRFDQFSAHKRAKDGLQYQCRECDGYRARRYYAKNRKRILRQRKEHRKTEYGGRKCREAGEKYYRTEHGRRTQQNRNFKRRYGITLEQHKQMYADQNGYCAILVKYGGYCAITVIGCWGRQKIILWF